jgi:hypothetical protein
MDETLFPAHSLRQQTIPYRGSEVLACGTQNAPLLPMSSSGALSGIYQVMESGGCTCGGGSAVSSIVLRLGMVVGMCGFASTAEAECVINAGRTGLPACDNGGQAPLAATMN